MSVFDKLRVGPDHVRIYTVEGVEYPLRNGTRSERNKIEASFANDKTPMDSVAMFMFVRAANPDGSRYFEGVDFRDMANELDFDIAKKLLVLAQTNKADGEEELPDDMDLDTRMDQIAKKSKSPKKDNTSDS